MGIQCKKAMRALQKTITEQNLRIFQVKQMESQGTRTDHGKRLARLDTVYDWFGGVVRFEAQGLGNTFFSINYFGKILCVYMHACIYVRTISGMCAYIYHASTYPHMHI